MRDLHLKGSGRTPFARGGDGLAAVGPMLREYVVSEAMHALGIPTTRSLAVVATGRGVQREIVLPGAVLTRVASSHLRVGSFQYARATGDLDLLRRLTDHAIARHHPEAAQGERPALALFEAVLSAQASLVAQWMTVGFIHGVMNTDNMTISGETIDYGPCAFMDAFDPATVYSSIDTGGRYAYGNQPAVAQWNLARLAESLLPLIHDDQEQAIALATESLGAFVPQYDAAWSGRMKAKLGLPTGLEDALASGLVEDLVVLLQANHVDHSSFFRLLGRAARGQAEPVRGLVLDLPRLDAWLDRWRALGPDAELMDRVNPAYVPRNHLVEEALEAATADDLEPMARLLEVVRAPFEERPGLERYAEPAPEDFGRRYQTFCGTERRASRSRPAPGSAEREEQPDQPGDHPEQEPRRQQRLLVDQAERRHGEDTDDRGDDVEPDARVDLGVVHEDRRDREAGRQVQDRGDREDGHHPALHVGQRLLGGLRPLVAAVHVVRVQQVSWPTYGGHALVVAHVTSLPRPRARASSARGEVPLSGLVGHYDRRVHKLTTLGPYSDEDGNEVVTAATYEKNIQITFRGSNNRVEIAEGCRIDQLRVVFDCDNGTLTIGHNKHVKGGLWGIRVGQDATVSIGNNVSSTGVCIVSAVEGVTVRIGNDVMIASQNQIRADDGHPIFDIHTGLRVNPATSITIGNHVWLALGSTVLAGGRDRRRHRHRLRLAGHRQDPEQLHRGRQPRPRRTPRHRLGATAPLLPQAVLQAGRVDGEEVEVLEPDRRGAGDRAEGVVAASGGPSAEAEVAARITRDSPLCSIERCARRSRDCERSPCSWSSCSTCGPTGFPVATSASTSSSSSPAS